MLFADMNNLLYRYYHTNKDKTFKDILNIVENYLIKVMEKKKIDEGFLFFDPIKIKDKTWRYEFKPNYKDNKLQETLFDIKKDFFIENNNDFSNNINELKFNILNNRFLEVQFLFEKWNIPLDENKLKKLEPLDLIKSYEKLIENNTKTKKEINNRKIILNSIYNINLINYQLKQYITHLVNNIPTDEMKSKILKNIENVLIKDYNINPEFFNYEYDFKSHNITYNKLLNIIDNDNLEEELKKIGLEDYLSKLDDKLEKKDVDIFIKYVYDNIDNNLFNKILIPKVEADDAIYVYSKIFKEQENIIISNDVDLEQIILDSTTTILDKNLNDKDVTKKIVKKQLLGDSSDNISSVVQSSPIKIQFGEKTFDKEYENLDNPTILTGRILMIEKIKEYVTNKFKKHTDLNIELSTETVDYNEILNNLLINSKYIPSDLINIIIENHNNLKNNNIKPSNKEEINKMNIKTSYFTKLNTIDTTKVETIAIPLKLLDFIDKDKISQHRKELALNSKKFWEYKKLVKENPELAKEKYIETYNNQLNDNDIISIMKDIIKEAQNKNKKEILLMCYEGPDKFCHRHILASRINKLLPQLNIDKVVEKDFEITDFSKEYQLPTKLEKLPNKTYLAITGHANIEKALDMKELDGKEYNIECFNKVKKEIENYINIYMEDKKIKDIKDIVFISGMARGADEIFALIAKENNCDLILAVPNSLNWHMNRNIRANGGYAQALNYQEILDYVNNNKNSNFFEIRKNYNGQIYKYANFARNDFMVLNADNIISYQRNRSPGTEHAIASSKKHGNYYGNTPIIKEKKPTLEIGYNKDLFVEKTHVLIQGCNCFHTMGAGVAKIIKDKYPMAYEADLETKKGDRNKLGTYSLVDVRDVKDSNTIYIVNLYSQFTYWDKNDMFDINAFEKGMNSIINDFITKRDKKNKKNIPIKFSFPAIGLGLANGKIKDIYNILKNLENKYKNKNIQLLLCLHPKDKELQKEFKILDNDFKIKKLKKNINIKEINR